jgi:hypothetical protein
LRPYPAEERTARKVGANVGNVRSYRPDLVKPIS